MEEKIVIKTKWPDTNKYKWHKQITLTRPEGAVMDKIITQFECQNVSQFCKKIVKGEIRVTKTE